MKDEAAHLISEFVRNEFPRIYDINESKRIWKEQSQRFRTFWENRIINNESDLSENEMIPVIQILDVVGRRRNEQERKVVGVAFTGIRQNTWYEMFRGLKLNRRVKELVNRLLRSTSDSQQIELLNRIREDGINITALAGENGTVLNAFLFAFKPEKNISAVALSDRYRIISFFEIGDVQEIQSLSWGERMISTRQKIMTLNERLNLKTDGRGICAFLYSDQIKPLWKQQTAGQVGKERKGKADVLSELQKRDHVVGPLINFRDMDYGPTEENGVIFLFSKITSDLGIRMVSIQKHFPDAEAIRYADDGRGYKVYIEFEYLSSDFLRHKHVEEMKNGKPCDLIVCWEHDSNDIPKEIDVLELKQIIRNLPKEAT